MGSLRFDGIRFIFYVADHDPPHTHAESGETAMILNLLADRQIAISARRDAVLPANAKALEKVHIVSDRAQIPR